MVIIHRGVGQGVMVELSNGWWGAHNDKIIINYNMIDEVCCEGPLYSFIVPHKKIITLLISTNLPLIGCLHMTSLLWREMQLEGQEVIFSP